MAEISDSILVEKALSGDVLAFRYLVERTQQMVYQVSFRFLRDQHDAEDAVQEVYSRLWKNLRKYDDRIKLTTWLYRITVNHCLDILKSARAKTRTEDISESLADHFPEPHQVLERRELLDQLHAAAARLTPRQQAAFILRDLEGLSVSEACSALDMNEGQLKSNLYYARKNLQRMIKIEMLRP
ncbi:RNA polymerase sigma factor [Fulvivirga sedimenti]|uniref:Sigma-70 family RNA polymerase sigma factor n=1 Tax=Fulvivirga sedimenti TaxID=2879465 RepID=A0A9X1HNW0_9BACT|nr:sigma-70 family RNA polymerase sigma factor [Fulvivirga sedimenti]MCA6074258.1 sigma-70 family RNA polymerase sigma factor [Fulvivirga sedimenti]